MVEKDKESGGEIERLEENLARLYKSPHNWDSHQS